MDRAWYVVHTYSGQEERVKSNLEKAINNCNLSDRIFQILIPTEEVMEIKRNKKQIKKRKFFPGYVLIDMIIDNSTYWAVRNIPGVSGFLGDKNPTPLPVEEVKNIIDLSNEPTSKPRPSIIFEKGENVRIVEGPFCNFVGVVEEINEEKGKLKAMVSIFGRSTPVELDFLQVEKL